MKKILFGAMALLLLGACSGSNSSKIDNQDRDSIESIDTAPQSEVVPSGEQKAQLDTLTQASIAKEEKKEDATVAKYNGMLDKYESLIKKCWSMSKKGLSINDQELADVWMKAGDVGSKLDKANKSLTPEQQNRLKKLNKDYSKFSSTQPA